MIEFAAFSHARGRTFSPTFAAIDLGTNNCRLLVGARAGRGIVVLESFSRIVRLGEGLDRTGRLSPGAMDRALTALNACAERLVHWRPTRVSAIATEACRRASNGREFLHRVQVETGIPITVVSAREETELAVESCTPLLARAGAEYGESRALLFDIGGGSTELAWLRLAPAKPPRVIGATSLPIGVVTLAERYGATAFTPVGFAAMVAETAILLRPFEAVHCIAHEIHRHLSGNSHSTPVCLLGTSGTTTTLAALALHLPHYSHRLVDGAVLTLDAVDRALEKLLALGRVGLLDHPCIGPERTPFVLPGAAIFTALREAWPAPHLVVADRGLREGMLLRLVQANGRPHARRLQTSGFA